MLSSFAEVDSGVSLFIFSWFPVSLAMVLLESWIIDCLVTFLLSHGRIFKKKAKNDQTKHGMEKTKSNRSQSQSKSKVNQVKKIQLEGLKLPNLKLYYKNKKTRAEIGNWGKYNLRGQNCQPSQNHLSRPTKPQIQLTGVFPPFYPATSTTPWIKHFPLLHYLPQLYNCHVGNPSPFPSDFDGLDDSKRSTRRLNG
ncbi:hypothetical protein Tco_0450586 [Tanacetum coccineum]